MIAAIWNRVNTKRFWPTAGAVFAWIFLSDFIIHKLWLKSAYQKTASLWRPEAEMGQYMSWMMSGEFLTAFFLSFIFTKGYEGKGWQEGARYGAFMGLFSVSQMCMNYAVTPLPSTLFWSWVGAGMFQAIMAGVIASWVYKK
ncbi:MAG: hypothetical protein KA715_00925 [Xanthomonadaceae bacterium]|nr:hypothetical protein [Xanthomonadaceae bacterium]